MLSFKLVSISCVHFISGNVFCNAFEWTSEYCLSLRIALRRAVLYLTRKKKLMIRNGFRENINFLMVKRNGEQYNRNHLIGRNSLYGFSLMLLMDLFLLFIIQLFWYLTKIGSLATAKDTRIWNSITCCCLWVFFTCNNILFPCTKLHRWCQANEYAWIVPHLWRTYCVWALNIPE